MRVALHGHPPASILQLLTEADLHLAGEPDLHLAWLDEDGLVALRGLARPGGIVSPLVALLGDAGLIDAAIQAGATEIVPGDLPPAELRLRLERHRQILQRLRGRFQAQLPGLRAQLHLAEALQQAAQLASPDPMVSADLRGQVQIFNPAAEAMLGYSASYAAAHLHVSDLYANPADARRVLAEIRRQPDKVLRDLPVRLRARNGEPVTVRLSAAEVLDIDGLPAATVGIFRDQRAEQDLQSRLQQATDQLIDGERRLGRARATMTAVHELNQPLTALMGAIELLEMSPDLPPDARGRLEKMLQQLERMAEIVRGLARQPLPATSLK